MRYDLSVLAAAGRALGQQSVDEAAEERVSGDGGQDAPP